ncbi:MAG: hypothetical protein K0S44_1242 [Bacteroidetes bacterium]|jgi:hypothetical protein|nr:hypothetical protein [Bacteroidota bacterium]
MRPIIKTILWLTLFSIAMGYLETSVVVYLRKIYYPEGFQFPLIPIEYNIAVTEFWREAATIVMLVGIGIVTGKNSLQRFVFFLYSFAIWDIFYYIFLKVLLNWPQSLLTWDILFLIPVPWVGPVIAPCMVSLSMILLTFIVVYSQEKGMKVYITFIEWLLLIAGSVIAIISFMWDYIIYVSGGNAEEKAVWTLSGSQDMFQEVMSYVPSQFNWWLFGIGQGLILISIAKLYFRYKSKKLNYE